MLTAVGNNSELLLLSYWKAPFTQVVAQDS